jgi:hypothetical protein
MLGLMVTLVQASSHREAPFITEVPKVDGTDLYMFRSYEPSREGFVTIIANYVPIQVPYGGPNYFSLDPDALYEIHIDNNGDANEDLTFRFRFQNTLQDIALDIGQGENVQRVSIPLINAGTLGPQVTDNANANVIETYTLTLVRGDRRTGTATPIANAANGERLPNRLIISATSRFLITKPMRAITSMTSISRAATAAAGCLLASVAKRFLSTWGKCLIWSMSQIPLAKPSPPRAPTFSTMPILPHWF